VGKGKAGRPATRQAEVRAYVEETIAREGMAPSYGMIRQQTGIRSFGEVRQIVCALERRGVFRRAGAGRVRRIQLPQISLV
jgi:SOS-response transcriptional repressor LexA